MKELILNQVTLNQLKVFDAVVRHGSFNIAAKKLYVSQPSISLNMKQLSETVGLPLFEKVGRQQSLTEAGHELFATCQEIFGSIAKFEETISNLKSLDRGRLRLAAFTTAKYLIPLTLGKFCQLYPGVDISLQLMNYSAMTERMSGNLDDLYIMSQIPEDIEVKYHPFFQDSLVVIASANHPLAREKNIPLKRLTNEFFIMRESDSGSRRTVQSLLNEHELTVKVKLELSSNESIKQVVAQGLGISVLSRQSLSSEIANSELTVLDVEGFPIKRDWYIVYPAKKQLSIIASTYLSYLLETGMQFVKPNIFDTSTLQNKDYLLPETKPLLVNSLYNQQTLPLANVG